MKRTFLAPLVIFSTLALSNAQQQGGIKGKQAPELKIDQWVHLPEGKAAPTTESLKDKVIYLYCYQSWCPGCHSSGFPSLKKVSTNFKENENVEFIVVQTVFEGFSVNSPDKWEGIATKFELQHIPFGHSGSKDNRSSIMRDFKTRGTPWAIIIGKDGLVKYNAFHIKPESAIELIDKLLTE